jgi:hypothetical protein
VKNIYSSGLNEYALKGLYLNFLLSVQKSRIYFYTIEYVTINRFDSNFNIRYLTPIAVKVQTRVLMS